MSQEQKDLEIKAENLSGGLGDDEVEAVAGGDTCVCVIGGHGEEEKCTNGGNEECICVVGGFGTYDKGMVDLRCGCPFVGGGVDK